MKTLSIDFIRQVLEQTMFKEHIFNNKLYGGKNQVSILSFYEQLQKEDEVNRYVEIYRDLVDQQNRTGLIANGVIVAPENPQIININSSMIIPMSWTLTFRCTLENRDTLIETLDNLSKQLRGRKQDIAELNTGELFMVGTPFQNDGKPAFKVGDYVGDIGSSTLQSFMQTLKNAYNSDADWFNNKDYFYYSESGIIKVGRAIKDPTTQVWTYEQITQASPQVSSVIFPPEHSSFTKYKISISFDTTRVDEPRTMNSQDYCTISIGGSATLVNYSVMLGNDISKVSIIKSYIKAENDVTFPSETTTYLEPLEIPSGLGISNRATQLLSSFTQGKHNDGINPTINYSFVLDSNIPLLKKLYKYARYGKVDPLYGVSPNIVYLIKEFRASWGEYEIDSFYAKFTDNIDVENTESDSMTISLQAEIQDQEVINNGNNL